MRQRAQGRAQSLSSYSDSALGSGLRPLRLRMSSRMVFAWVPSASGSCNRVGHKHLFTHVHQQSHACGQTVLRSSVARQLGQHALSLCATLSTLTCGKHSF